MKNKKLLAVLALTLSFSMGLTACSFGGKKEEEVIVEESAEEQEVEIGPTEAPEPTGAPDMQVSTYTSADGKIAINLPDATWSVKADQEDLYSFESPEHGSIMVEHGAGEDALSTQIIPKTQDTAETMESGEAGTDYEIRNYAATEEGGNGIYSYTVKMLKEDSSNAYKLCKIFANDAEFYILTGNVVNDDTTDMAEIQSAMETFAILDEASTLKALAAPATDGTEGAKAEEKSEPEEAQPEEKEEAEEEAPAPEQSAAAGGIAPSRDNPDNADNTKTRTIYTNDGAGRAIVVTLNADGVWVDAAGNQYRFQNVSDCYDQNDVSYYYHGEAADVYFMPAN